MEAPASWNKVHACDARARALADRHYNRRAVGSPRFTPPGRVLCLLTPCERAVWASRIARFQRHAWPGAWENPIFRNEGAGRSSDLIRAAVLATTAAWGFLPLEGMITFVDARKVRAGRPGWCFLKAGFERVGETEGGHGRNPLVVLRLDPREVASW